LSVNFTSAPLISNDLGTYNLQVKRNTDRFPLETREKHILQLMIQLQDSYKVNPIYLNMDRLLPCIISPWVEKKAGRKKRPVDYDVHLIIIVYTIKNKQLTVVLVPDQCSPTFRELVDHG
jgi:hypothetical protein